MLPKFLKPYQVNKLNLLRIGPKKDGGYVIDKRIINQTKILVTCGLNDDWEFEKDYIKYNNQAKVLAFDHTIDKNFWVKRFKKDIIAFIKLKKLKPNKIIDIFKYIDYKTFFNNKNIHILKKIVSKEKNKKEITINAILKNLKNVLLKVDIEGNEYQILKEINKNSRKLNLLIIEVHKVSKNLDKIKKFIKTSKLKLIHIHGNNYTGIDNKNMPRVLELTFLNGKKFKLNNKRSNYSYPINGLDYKNLKRKDDIKLSFHE